MQCLASLRACDYTPKERTPIDLVLVIDKSGSMGGEKMGLTRETAELVAKELGAADRLSIVTYDAEVECPMPLTRMDQSGKTLAAKVITTIRAGTTTNLSGGLMRGIEELTTTTPAETASVLLMTDGLANNGIRDTDGIVRCMQGVLGEKPNFTVFTFGYGADHNAEMLRSISDAGGGQYYYMEDGDAVATSFADCLGGLLSVVGQNTRLKLQAAGGATVLRVLGQGYPTVGEGTDTLEITLGDIYSEESKDLLFEVAIPVSSSEGEEENQPRTDAVIVASLSYLDVVHSQLVSAEAATITVTRAKVAGEPEQDVHEQLNRVEAAEALLKSSALARAGDYECGRAVLATVEGRLLASPAALTPLTTQLVADLKEAASGMTNAHEYRSRGSYACESYAQGHSKQRSNRTLTRNDLEGEPMFAAASPYETKKKRAMQKKWSDSRSSSKREPACPQQQQPQQNVAVANDIHKMASAVTPVPQVCGGARPPIGPHKSNTEVQAQETQSFVVVQPPELQKQAVDLAQTKSVPVAAAVQEADPPAAAGGFLSSIFSFKGKQ